MTQALVLIDIVLYRIFVRLKDTRFDLCAPVTPGGSGPPFMSIRMRAGEIVRLKDKR
jgi:hypothetical protein